MAEPTDPLSLADLVPAPLTIRDTAPGGDGAIVELRLSSALSPTELALVRRMQQEVNGAYGKAEAGDAEAAQRIEAGVDTLLGVIAPAWPPERIRAVPYVYKIHLLEWWSQVQPSPLAPRPASRPTPRGKPSRGSRSPASRPPS